MSKNEDLADLKQEWRAFLQRNHDAKTIINALSERSGLRDDEVFVFLLAEWLSIDLERNHGASI